MVWRPQWDSNPCFGLERATSWASGRWGLRVSWGRPTRNRPGAEPRNVSTLSRANPPLRCVFQRMLRYEAAISSPNGTKRRKSEVLGVARGQLCPLIQRRGGQETVDKGAAASAAAVN